MPTTLPRIAVTLTPQASAALRQLATLTRQSQSRIVGDLVEDAIPLMLKTSRMLHDAARLTSEAKAALRIDLAKHEVELQENAARALVTLAAADAAVEKARASDARSARRPASSAAAAPRRRTPPSCNGGA